MRRDGLRRRPSGAELRARIHRTRRQSSGAARQTPNTNDSPLDLTLIIHLESIRVWLAPGPPEEFRPGSSVLPPDLLRRQPFLVHPPCPAACFCPNPDGSLFGFCPESTAQNPTTPEPPRPLGNNSVEVIDISARLRAHWISGIPNPQGVDTPRMRKNSSWRAAKVNCGYLTAATLSSLRKLIFTGMWIICGTTRHASSVCRVR